jgi:hypothetical protein
MGKFTQNGFDRKWVKNPVGANQLQVVNGQNPGVIRQMVKSKMVTGKR